jgi:hypothetical protein
LELWVLALERWRLTLEMYRLIKEPCRISLEPLEDTRDPWKLNMNPYGSPGSEEVQLGAWWTFNQSHLEPHPEATQDRIIAIDSHLEETKAQRC